MVHSAVLLAGGKSSRMGRDKAAIMFEGIPLWRRQLDTLAATAPAELLISGPLDGSYRESGCPILTDGEPSNGPLGGLARVMADTTSPWLLVLAVDLPMMSAAFLCSMVEAAEETGCGIVPTRGFSDFEPLAAIYPKEAVTHIKELLQTGERKLSRLVERLRLAKLIELREIRASDEGLFTNWNSPSDLPGVG